MKLGTRLGFRLLRACLWLAVLAGLWWSSASEAGLAGLAHEVRIVRYAATGNSAAIPGSEFTPGDKQNWLNAIAAALSEANGFFYKPVFAGIVTDRIHGSHDTWAYDPVVLAPAATEESIKAALGEVTWIVLTNLEYFTHCKPRWADFAFTGWSRDEAIPTGDLDHWCSGPPTEYGDGGTQPYGQSSTLICTRNGMEYDYEEEDWKWLCWYWIYYGSCGVEGCYRAPYDVGIQPVFAGHQPPGATAIGYYVGEHGGEVALGGFRCRYDATWMLSDSYRPSLLAPPDPDPDCESESSWAYNSWADYVYVAISHAHIQPPELPEETGTCPACMAECQRPPESVGPSTACPSCGSPVFHVNPDDLTVTVTDTPIWRNTPTGPALSVRLSFHVSRVADTGDFGRGWTWDYGMRISNYGTGAKIVSSGTGRGGWWFMANGDGTWAGPPSTGCTLAYADNTWTMTKPSGDRYAFDTNGRLLSATNRYDEALFLAYDGNGRVQSMTDANGTTMTFTRNGQGRVTAVSEPGGRSATFSYDEDGFLTDCVDMGGFHCRYEYGRYPDQPEPVKNLPGPITKIEKNVTETSSEPTTFVYSVSQTDAQQELRVTDPEANVTLYRWDQGDTGVFTRVDPNGGVTSELYATIGMRKVLVARIDALENEWTYGYDSAGFLVQETDPLANVTTYTRNPLGNVLTETRPGSAAGPEPVEWATTTYTYAANGEDVLTETDPLGNTTTYAYDADRNVVSVTNALEQVTSFTYDAHGRKLTEITPAGLVTTWSYTQTGHLASVARSTGETTAYTYNARGLAASITSPDGLVVQRAYDDLDRVVTETYVAPNPADNTTMAYTYGCCGLEQIVDRHGTITRYEYDQNHRRVATLDHFDNRTEFTYDGNGNQIKGRDPLANETVTAYDLLNRPSTIAYPDQTTEAFEYDALGRQARHTDRSGRVSIIEYDARGNVTATKAEVPGDPDPIVYTLSTTTYNLADRQTSTTNANGLTIGYGYDALGRVTTETYPDQTTITRVYGTAGMTSQTDRLGNTTAFTYDAAGRVLTVTDALNHTTTYTYNAAGHQATVTNALAQTTSFAYDQEGRLVTTTHADDSTETRAYAKDGLLSSLADRTGVVTAFTYDAMARRLVTAVVDPGPPASSRALDTVTYDTLGRVATQTDARGITVALTYDAVGRLTRRTMPDQTHEDFAYGPDGLLTHADRAGRTTTYTYDVLGRRASETNPNSEMIGYEYSLAGQMTKLTDANGNVTQWTYDTEGRLSRKTYADASHYDYTHDAGGRLLTRTDGMSRTTAYTYSATGQLLTVDYPTDPDVAYTYDALGRRLTMTDATGTTTWTYDTATGQPATVTHNPGPPASPRAIAYTWDPGGRRLSTAVDGTTLATYTYDTQARMATVTPGTAGVPPASFTYSYLNASNQVTGIDMPGELAVARTYDALGRLASVTNAAGNTAISAFAYAYDQSDRRTRVDLVDGGRWEYTYDNTGQLTGGTRYGPKLDQQQGTLVQYAYQYDAMGNPTSRTEDAGVSAYTFNNLNQLVTGQWSGTLSAFGWTRIQGLASVSVATGQQTQPATVFQKGEWTAKGLQLPAGDTTLTVVRTAQDQTQKQAETAVTRPADGTAYSHDLNGNLLGDGTWSYTWDDENRLVRAERAGAPASPRARLESAYDAIGRRRLLREYAWQDNAWVLALERRYTWDGWLPVHEETTDYSTTPATTHVDVYVRGLDLSGSQEGAGGIGGMLALVHDGSLVCYLDNGRGDITELADPETGAAVAHYEHDPFGRQLISSGPLAEPNRYRFSSKEEDPTGLYYYGLRYCDPASGRWLSRDPLGEVGGVCLYRMLRNSPCCTVDGHGLVAATSGLGGGALSLISLVLADPYLRMVLIGQDILTPTLLDLADSSTLGFFQTAWMWLFGGGPATVSFAAYDPGWGPRDFPGFSAQVARVCANCGLSLTLAPPLVRMRDLYRESMYTIMRMGGPGRYDVLLNGRISSTCTMWGCMWSFGGRISIRPDIINFNTGRPGERTPEGELITRIVSFLQTKFGIGHDFPVTFEGGRDVTTSGLCSRALLP